LDASKELKLLTELNFIQGEKGSGEMKAKEGQGWVEEGWRKWMGRR